jgi:DNA-binding winged helix-turn-helix (wHTH) protein/tetratricopeptide (TPR) repeat protein
MRSGLILQNRKIRPDLITIAAMVYRFGPFRADRAAYQAFKGDRPLPLTPKLLDLLFHLLERPATLVTKEELLDAVWPGANVTDNALAQAVSELRDALGDSPQTPIYIRTIARRGYRFVAPVDIETAGPGDARAAREPDLRAPAGRPSVAVLDFANVTGDADVAWLASGIAETVSTDMAALARFRVIDRWRVHGVTRTTAGSPADLARQLGADLLVSGSYQRSGPNLRITARLHNPATGDVVADAKVDGLLAEAFVLQDGIAAAFSRALGLQPAPRAVRPVHRETSSLDAYRAYTEGWLRLESLDTALVDDAIRAFEQAIAIDPQYAMAYTGLANAEFVAFEMTRASPVPDDRVLAAGIEHVRRAIALDDGLAEAHATLSFLLTSACSFDEARAAAERAVALEPDSWRHQYRLGHAAWGAGRLRALERALALYPQFAYARFEMAMVHVARGNLTAARAIAQPGAAEQDRQARAGERFPAIGFHWLLGALDAAEGRPDAALEAFERELAQVGVRRLYGPEYGALTLTARGHAELALGRAEAALADFRAARGHIAGFARAYLGEALALEHLGDPAAAAAAWLETARARRLLDNSGRAPESLLVGAAEAASAGQPETARERLAALVDFRPGTFIGWTMPIEPALASVRGRPAVAALARRLADRAE